MRLPRLFSPGMVVQQELPIPVWGWSRPAQPVRVTLAGRSAETVAGPKGSWMVRLPALKAADHRDAALTLTVIGDETVTIDDVAVGEVWLCAGQSNMEWPVHQAEDAKREIGAAKFPGIRLFTVDRLTAAAPCEDVQPGARWRRCSPESVARFSAVGYFFGRELHRSLDVPVGLILSAWGGTLAEAWTSRAALASETPLRPILERLAAMPKLPTADSAAFKRAQKAWETRAYHRDPGNQGARKGWAKPAFDDASWPVMDLPRSWESTGLDIDGAVWFRRTVELPAAWRGKALSLSLGPIDDFDTTYVNGVEVGGIGSDTPNAHLVPRVYAVPGKLVKGGKLVIAVRVFDRFGVGGLVGDPTQLTLALAPAKPAAKGGGKAASAKAAGKAIPLAGDWRYQIELRLEPRRNLPPPPLHATHQDLPATLNNAMIQPLVPYALRGVLWYQGESNAERAEQYRTLLPALLRDWRMAWGQRDLHIGIVQLANWRERRPTPGDSDWAELREAQAFAAAQPGNGLAVAIDIGDASDIHPRNKQEVGRRLALWARAAIHHQTIPHSGPRYATMAIEGASIRLRFTHADGGLASSDGRPLTGFAIAGHDRAFVWAEARIDGGEVVVTSPQVPRPLAARYAWADNPACNLVNGARLPAVPFRTDDWPLSTAGRR
jgi:sialate O-acetylesterase